MDYKGLCKGLCKGPIGTVIRTRDFSRDCFMKSDKLEMLLFHHKQRHDNTTSSIYVYVSPKFLAINAMSLMSTLSSSFMSAIGFHLG